MYEELSKKIRDLIRSITNNSGNYEQIYMKIYLNSDNDLSLKKTLELYMIIIIVRSFFHEGSKHYSQVFINECLYKL